MDTLTLLITAALFAGLVIGGYAARLREQRNKGQEWNEARRYHRLNNPFNRSRDMLLTENEVQRAERRAERNQEDLT